MSASHPVSGPSRSHKVAIVGGGSAGLTIGHQLLRTGDFQAEDIAIIDTNEWHHYQLGWTLVGGGLKDKRDLRARLSFLVDPKISLYAQDVSNLTPEQNMIALKDGYPITYD